MTLQQSLKGVNFLDNLDLDNFESVWNRVSPHTTDNRNITTEEKEDKSAEKLLAEFIKNEHESSQFYKSLSLKTKNRNTSSIFSKLSSYEAHHMQRLQTEYFLLTGDIISVESYSGVINFTPEALYLAYKAEVKSHKEYEKAALTTSDKELSRLFSHLSKEEWDHASVIRDITAQLLS